MLQALLYPLADQYIVFNVFKYITFRTFGGLAPALILYFLLGKKQIDLLQRWQVGKNIREEGPSHHMVKAGTPTMGGVLILLCVVVATILWMDLKNSMVWMALVVYASFALIGFWDDW